MAACKMWCIALVTIALPLAACSGDEGADVTTTVVATTVVATTAPTTSSSAVPSSSMEPVHLNEIIVTLDVPWKPEADLSPEEVASQRAAIADAQQQLIDLLDGTQFEVKVRYELTAQLALAVDDEALARIEDSTLVLGSTEDTPDPAGG